MQFHKPVSGGASNIYVKLTATLDTSTWKYTYTCEKTYEEIRTLFDAGNNVFLIFSTDSSAPETYIMHLESYGKNFMYFVKDSKQSSEYFVVGIFNDNSLYVTRESIYIPQISVNSSGVYSCYESFETVYNWIDKNYIDKLKIYVNDDCCFYHVDNYSETVITAHRLLADSSQIEILTFNSDETVTVSTISLGA